MFSVVGKQDWVCEGVRVVREERPVDELEELVRERREERGVHGVVPHPPHAALFFPGRPTGSSRRGGGEAGERQGEMMDAERGAALCKGKLCSGNKAQPQGGLAQDRSACLVLT